MMRILLLMSALAEHPSTGSVSASASLAFGQHEAEHPLADEPIRFDVLVPALLSMPEEPEEDYPAGVGPYGF